jgi:hypothetical protein
MAMAIGPGSPVMSPWVNKSPAASGLRGRQGFYSAPWKRTNINARRADLFRAVGTMAGRAASSQALHIGSASELFVCQSCGNVVDFANRRK